MFDIGWSELLIIAVVLIVVVGPKDLPGMLRTFGRTTRQLKAMASDFRRQFDEALEEAELDDMKSAVDDFRKLDPRKEIRAAMNPMKAIGDEIRSSLNGSSASTRVAPAPKAEPAAGDDGSATERGDGGPAFDSPVDVQAGEPSRAEGVANHPHGDAAALQRHERSSDEPEGAKPETKPETGGAA